jgi:hypothetical protein
MTEYEKLRELFESGQFHHATYRDIGKVWEGLYFYKKDPEGMRGFSLVGCIGKNDPDLPLAEDLVRGTGVSVGSYGAG